MKRANTVYRYPLRLERADKKKIDSVVRNTGSSLNQVLVTSIRKGLPLAEQALTPNPAPITNVESLPDSVLREVYSQRDDWDNLSADQVRKAQSQKEPE